MRPLISKLKPFVERFPYLAHFYRYQRDSKALSKEPQYRDTLGFKFNGNPLMECGKFEPNETKIFESIIDKFDVCVNIGANTGYYTLKALHAGKHVIAFEPNSLNAAILLRNVAANGFEERLQFFPIALSDKPGILPMYGNSTGASLIQGWAGQYQAHLVPVNSFDNVVGDRLIGKKCLVLIDIEGAEYGCLIGAKSFLEHGSDNVLLVEISIAEHQPKGVMINPKLAETFELFFDRGYQAYTADEEPRKVELSEIRDIEATAIDTIGTHNFLFFNCHWALNDLRL